MEDNEIGIYKDKFYKAIEFKPKKEGDIACNHCTFELGKCRSRNAKIIMFNFSNESMYKKKKKS